MTQFLAELKSKNYYFTIYKNLEIYPHKNKFNYRHNKKIYFISLISLQLRVICYKEDHKNSLCAEISFSKKQTILRRVY